ncbi:signal protein [Paenibacillus sp. SSG-1]|uniref:cache domain-containing sensor histidine kinase n=1 Tax=Paenibacillus sp. PSB04 TaxID=2866810 RepID=UPI000B7D3873|nr:sensor histidine kinase [Paenibacillus sp. PSB04]OXL83516.1 signal protein [Paenibacillus sp. SSG-1]UYO02970.1 histidine kinase [Paenibacillus sp. PSB04]
MMRVSLRLKLLLYFTIVILLSLSAVGIAFYSISAKQLQKSAKSQMVQIVDNAVHHTNLYLSSYQRSMVALLTDLRVKRYIDLPADREEYENYRYMTDIRDAIVDPVWIRNPEIEALYIIGYSGNALYYYNGGSEPSFKPEDTAKQIRYFKENTDESGRLTIMNYSILGEKTPMMTLIRRIRGLRSTDMKGFVGIEVKAEELSTLWKGIDLGKDSYFFIVDGEGRIQYHNDQTKVGSIVPASLGKQISEAGTEMFRSSSEGMDRVYISRKAEYSGWNLVVSIPYSQLQKPLNTIRSSIIVVAVITFLTALFLASRFGKSITTPIRTLMKGMSQTEKGNWKFIPLPKHRDEITELMIRYNLMVNRLSEMVDTVYRAELRNKEMQAERQKAEFQSLQLQINPHFLYNTLETVVCYAVIQDSDEITEIVGALSYMLHYSVRTNLEEITVANELKHVMYFMVIINHRIGRTFEIDVRVRPELLLRKMVRLTLQPLVENVFQHAFRQGVEDHHTIIIDAGEEGDSFWVSVQDNGCGMAPERLEELRAKLSENRLADEEDRGSAGGIGVPNVHRRIQLVFGEDYGVTVESSPEWGTRMIMRMPISGVKELSSPAGQEAAASMQTLPMAGSG